jgi:hypothetical protein|tara:strand:+ start:292 stop:423 length:132 start_codon:yes stop_codon:yes gene_type:complete
MQGCGFNIIQLKEGEFKVFEILFCHDQYHIAQTELNVTAAVAS